MTEPTRVKADIIPSLPQYSGLVRSWIDSEETYRNVCRGTDFPPPDDIVDSWQHKAVTSYLLSSEGTLVAYGELWDRKMERAVEIAHLLVDRYRRSQGCGTKMLELLYNRASARTGITRVLINLYVESEEALGCFLKAGFELVGTARHVQGLQMVRTVRR